MLDAGDVHRRYSSARKGGEENPAKGIAKCRTIAALSGLYYIRTIGIVAFVFETLDTRLFYFYHITLLFVTRFCIC